jgi:hypothetical protein
VNLCISMPPSAVGEQLFADCKRRCEQRLAAADPATMRGELHVMIVYERSVTMYMAAELPSGRAAGFTKEEALARFEQAIARGIAMDMEDGRESNWVQRWRVGLNPIFSGMIDAGPVSGTLPAAAEPATTPGSAM